jgi:hypothetical protein
LAEPALRPPQNDRQLITDVLNRYAAAMTARSLAGVIAVFPMDDNVARELQANFDQIRSWRVTVAPPAIKLHPDEAAADVTATIRYDDVEYLARPGRRARSAASLTLHLRKMNGQWTIVRLNARLQ